MLFFDETAWKLDNAGKAWSYSETGDSMRFEVRPGDSWSADGEKGVERSEIKSDFKLAFKTTYTLSFDIKVEAGAENTAGWVNLMQLHGTQDAGDISGLGPVFSLTLDGEKMGVVTRADAAANSLVRPEDHVAYEDVQNIVRDQWYHIKAEITLDPYGQGVLKVWRDDSMLVNYKGAIGYNDFVGPYAKAGVYRDAANETLAVDIKNFDLDATPTASLAVSAPGAFSIAALSASKGEGDDGPTPFTFTVSRSGDASAAASVSYSVAGSGADAAGGSDFSAAYATSGRIGFVAGETSKVVTIYVDGDTAIENDQGFTVTIADPYGASIATSSATGLIKNDDALIKLGSGVVTKNEGDAGSTAFTFNVTRIGDLSHSATVDYNVAGNGANPVSASDFTGGVLPAGKVTFAAGETSKTITVNVAGDNLAEGDETFQLNITNPVGAFITGPTAQGVITNDDKTIPSLNVSAAKASIVEGSSGATPLNFTVTRAGDTSVTSSVSYAVGGSVNGSDFAGGVLPTGKVSFAAGETSKVVTLDVAGDTVLEGDETVTVTLSNAYGASVGVSSAQTVILNDDKALPTLNVAATSGRVAEGNSGTTPVTFTVTRAGDTSVASSATYTVNGSGDSPVGLSDFTGGVRPAGTVSFAAGEVSKTITVGVAGDTNIETDEQMTLSLSNATGATLGVANADVVVLNDDRPPPVMSVVAMSSSVTEGNSGATPISFTVTRAGDTSVASSATYTVNGSGATPVGLSDFVNGVRPTGTVSFAAGEVSKTVTISVAGDTAIETDEQLTLNLSSPVGATLGTASADVIIVNDDPTSTIQSSASPTTVSTLPTLKVTATSGVKLEGDTGSTPFTFTVTRSGDTTVASSATYTVTGTGSHPADPGDFVGGAFPTGTVSFAAGEVSKVISLAIKGETLAEWDESFTLSLSNPAGATLVADPTAQGLIINDDLASTTSTGVNALFSLPESGAYTKSLMGKVAPDTITGTAGNDFLDGSGGADTMNGGQGDDTYAVDRASDTVLEGASWGVDTVLSTSSTYTLAYGVENLKLVGGSAQVGIGNSLNNILTSNASGSTLYGGAGNDILIAGKGADLLTGGAGSDIFRFTQLPGKAGHITDFEDGQDMLDLRALFKTVGYTGSNPIADHYLDLRSDGVGGTAVYFDADGAGKGAAVLVTTVDHVAPSALTIQNDWFFQ